MTITAEATVGPWRPAVCKTGLAASRRRLIVHRVKWLKAAVRDEKLDLWAEWLCGGNSHEAVIIADPEPFGGVCPRCDMAGWLVYRCRNAAGDLLYIGSTGFKYQRFKNHARTSSWWSEVADIEETRQPDEMAARFAEMQAILAEHPIHNKQPGARSLAAFRAEAA